MTVTTRTAPGVEVREGSHVLSWFFLWLSGLVAVAFVLLYLWTTHYQGKIFPGVVIGDVSVGGLSPTSAQQRLTIAYPRPLIPPLELTWGGRTWWVYPQARFEFSAAVDEAYALGRTGSLWEQLQSQADLYRQGYVIPLRPLLDMGPVRTQLNALAAQVYRPVREPSVALDARGVTYRPGQPGREVDVTATWRALQHRIQALAAGETLSEPVPLVVRQVGPSSLDVTALKDATRRLTTQPFRIIAGDRVLALDASVIGKAVMLTPVVREGRAEARIDVNRDIIYQALKRLNDRYTTQPVDARLDYDPDNDRFIVLSPSQTGWTMDVDAGTDAVVAALKAGKNEAEVPVRVLEPRVPDDATPEALGIREIVGEGTTYFRGSSPARVRNIVRAADAVRGVVIPPGGVFSFNEAAGAITAANGYEDSLIIWGDRTAVGIGGGVCQVSTTLFRAVFFAGLPILERWNHGYIVSWYGEPGLDATVYSPYVDFKFQNTTDAYLLVQPIVDTQQGFITFRLWGTKPDWTVEVSKPIQEDVQEPPPPVYREDPKLPKGTIKQVEWAKPGMTVRITRTVRRGDTIIEQQEFVSRYQPWQAVYLYGPGTEIPGKK